MDSSAAARNTAVTVGRFAPSPSGRMHVGNAFASLMAWLAARAEGGRIRALYAEHFGKTCSKSLSCVEVCPMKIPTLASMAKLNRMKR